MNIEYIDTPYKEPVFDTNCELESIPEQQPKPSSNKRSLSQVFEPIPLPPRPNVVRKLTLAEMRNLDL
jgi:hypothetical protein